MTYLHPGIASSRGLQGGFGLGRVQMPPHPSASRGSRVLQGVCVAGTGAARGCCSGSGVSGTGPGSGTGLSPSPPPGAAKPPPPLPPWAGRTGTGARQCGRGGQGSAWGRPSAVPLAAQGCGSPSADPRGGLLSLGFTRQVQSSEGGAPNPPQPHLHLRARMGERTARDLDRVAPRRIAHRMEAQVLPSRRDTLGGQVG